MNVELGALAVGKWRYLTLPEIEKLNELVAESSKTDDSPEEKGPKRSAVQYIPKKKKAEVSAVAGEKAKKVTTEKADRGTGDRNKKGKFKEFRSKRSKR